MRKQMLKRILIGGVMCAAIGMMPARSEAALWTLQDANSVVRVDDSTQQGMYDWEVDGADQLFQQWFWYRIGAAGPEQSIETISAAAAFTSNTNFDPGQDVLTLKYTNPGVLEVEVKYSLLGGSIGSGNSDMGEQIKVTNLTGQAMDFHLFQYTDFDLNGTAGNDNVQFGVGNPNGSVHQNDILGGPIAAEVVSSPFANHHEADHFSNTRDRLNNGGPDTLSDSASAGPGDVTWAFEWDVTLASYGNPNSSFTISKNKNIYVPEPASLVLFGMGLIGAAGVARRRKAVVPQA